MGHRDFSLDEKYYEDALVAIGRLSRLYSDSLTPFYHYRFIENLFAKASKGKNISRQDAVFDVVVGVDKPIAVGVKTFIVAKNATYSFEKVQEFTALAGKNQVGKLKDIQLIDLIARERNRRIDSQAANFNIDLTKSIYHCLVRYEGHAAIHEEPYPRIKVEGIFPTTSSGKKLKKFAEFSPTIHFSDGLNRYKYYRAKNVLLKYFDLGKGENWDPIKIDISDDIFGDIFSSVLTSTITEDNRLTGLYEDSRMVPGLDFVILPLYSVKDGSKYLPEKSGLNQWNAAGRARKFGEAYIPVPATVHKLCPDFFPGGNSFDLYLPSSSAPINASLCQDNLKALMSNPNDSLCKWIFRVIDAKYTDDGYNKLPNRKPFNYDELALTGYDCVRVSRTQVSGKESYTIEFETIGAYEEFLENLEP